MNIFSMVGYADGYGPQMKTWQCYMGKCDQQYMRTKLQQVLKLQQIFGSLTMSNISPAVTGTAITMLTE